MGITFGASGENFSARTERRYAISFVFFYLSPHNDINHQYFYNDVFRYTPEKDEWRKFVSPTCPGPRSAHAVVSSPAGGDKHIPRWLSRQDVTAGHAHSGTVTAGHSRQQFRRPAGATTRDNDNRNDNRLEPSGIVQETPEVQWFSRPPPSTTRPSLRVEFLPSIPRPLDIVALTAP